MTETERRLQRIAQTFDEVNRRYFDGVIPVPTIRVSARMISTAGTVFCATWSMVISNPYHDYYGWEDELVDTVKHETIHLYLAYRRRPTGHTKEFKAISARIGATLYGKPMPRRRPRYRYLMQCPHCQGYSWCGRWDPTWACKPCCDKHNEGRYVSEFVLTLVKREVVPTNRLPQYDVTPVAMAALTTGH